MARRSDHTQEELRELILEAAERAMAGKGLAGLSARDIARDIGYSPGTIYNIFANLDDVVLNVEARVLDRLDAKLGQVPARGTPLQQIRRLAIAYLEFTRANPKLWGLLFEHTLPARTKAPAWYAKRLARLLGRLEVALLPLFPTSQHAAAARTARVLWASVHGIASLAVADKLANVTNARAEVMLDDLIRTYIAGLAQHSGRTSRS